MRRHSLLPNQWEWTVWFAGFPSFTLRIEWARGIEGTEENAWQAAHLAREEIWELLQ